MIEVETFESDFGSQFLGSSTVVSQPSNFLYAQFFEQESNETPAQYISRARELMSFAGGKRKIPNDLVFDMGRQIIIQGFVSGLYEESVKSKAIENRVMEVIFLEDLIKEGSSAIQTLPHLYL
ncbi:hypothetical protein EPUL_005607, partial [Erysiphe pulchra]